jgi:hypothetical protein
MDTPKNTILFPLIDTTGIEKIIMSAVETMEPIHASLSSILESNRYLFGQMQEAADAMESLSKTINDAYAMTIPAIDAANDMADVFKNISQTIAPFYGISEAKSVEVIARPAASEAKEIIRKRLPVKKIIVPLKLPSDIGWENIRAKFIDAHTVFIETTPYDLKYGAGYRDMGMRNAHTGAPNMQWKMLSGLAQMGGVISWSGSEIVPAKAKKQKQLLSNALIAYFGINEDPFITDRKARAYKLKMILNPEPVVEENADRPDHLGIEEELSKEGKYIFDPSENVERKWSQKPQ